MSRQGILKRLTVSAICAILFVGLICGLSGVITAKEAYIGNWVVEKVLQTAPGATLSKAKSKTYLKTTLQLAEKSASFGKKTCKDPYYQVSELVPDDLTSGWNMSAKKLGLGSSILMIEVYTGRGMSADLWPAIGTLFVKNNNYLLMHVDGVFFQLKRK